MSECPKGRKSSWPELVGMDGEAAKKVIEAETGSGVKVTIVEPGFSVTTDFLCDRVRIYVDDHGRVTLEPKIG